MASVTFKDFVVRAVRRGRYFSVVTHETQHVLIYRAVRGLVIYRTGYLICLFIRRYVILWTFHLSDNLLLGSQFLVIVDLVLWFLGGPDGSPKVALRMRHHMFPGSCVGIGVSLHGLTRTIAPKGKTEGTLTANEMLVPLRRRISSAGVLACSEERLAELAWLSR